MGGTQPNLDLVAESETDVVGVESKFLEYLTPKKPHFASSYKKENLPQAEDCWLDLIVELKGTMLQALEAAQLVKHYLGLQNQYPDKKITLFYLFWEPRDWQNFELFRKHRKQIEFFVDKVKESEVSFAAQSYPELWDDCKKKEILGHPVTFLSERYGIDIPPDNFLSFLLLPLFPNCHILIIEKFMEHRNSV